MHIVMRYVSNWMPFHCLSVFSPNSLLLGFSLRKKSGLNSRGPTVHPFISSPPCPDLVQALSRFVVHAWPRALSSLHCPDLVPCLAAVFPFSPGTRLCFLWLWVQQWCSMFDLIPLCSPKIVLLLICSSQTAGVLGLYRNQYNYRLFHLFHQH